MARLDHQGGNTEMFCGVGWRLGEASGAPGLWTSISPTGKHQERGAPPCQNRARLEPKGERAPRHPKLSRGSDVGRCRAAPLGEGAVRALLPTGTMVCVVAQQHGAFSLISLRFLRRFIEENQDKARDCPMCCSANGAAPSSRFLSHHKSPNSILVLLPPSMDLILHFSVNTLEGKVSTGEIRCPPGEMRSISGTPHPSYPWQE